MTVFQIGDRVVRLGTSKPIVLNDGDVVFVAGKRGNDFLRAAAVRNVATGVVTTGGGAAGYVLMMIAIFIFGFVTSVCLAVFIFPSLIVLFLFTVWGMISVFRRWMDYRRAVRWVQTATV